MDEVDDRGGHHTARLGGTGDGSHGRPVLGSGLLPFGTPGVDHTQMNCGILYKKGKGNRSWKKRYFWLCTERQLLFYFKMKNEKGNPSAEAQAAIQNTRPTKQDVIPLAGAVLHEQGDHHRQVEGQAAYAFTVTVQSGRDYQLVATGDDAQSVVRSWLNAIEGLDGRPSAVDMRGPAPAAAPMMMRRARPQPPRPPPQRSAPRTTDLDPTQCNGYVVKGGLQRTAAANVPFAVLLRTRAGVVVGPPSSAEDAPLVRFSLDGFAVAPLERASADDAMHRLRLDLLRAGSRVLHVRVAATDAPIAGSPFIFDVVAAAASARHSKLTHHADVDAPSFELTLLDEFGNAATLGEAQQLAVTATPSPPYHMVSVKPRPGMVGVYTGTYLTDNAAVLDQSRVPLAQIRAELDGVPIGCVQPVARFKLNSPSTAARVREGAASAAAAAAAEGDARGPILGPTSLRAATSSTALEQHALQPIFDAYIFAEATKTFSLRAMRAFVADFRLVDTFLVEEQVESAFYSALVGGSSSSSSLSFESWLVAIELLALAKYPGDSRATSLLIESVLLPRYVNVLR